MSWTTFNDNYTIFLSKMLSLFQVDINDLMENMFQLSMQETKTTMNITKTFYYWEYEIFIKLLNKKNKEQQEDSNNTNKGQSNNIDPNAFLAKMNTKIPKLPK